MLQYCGSGLIQDGWIALNQPAWNGQNYYYYRALIQTSWTKYYMSSFDIINLYHIISGGLGALRRAKRGHSHCHYKIIIILSYFLF